MPFEFEFELDEAKRIVFSRAWGELTDDDLLSHLTRIADSFRRGGVESTWSHIADFTEVTSYAGVSSDGVRQMAHHNPWPEESLRALIVPKDLPFGLARMYQAYGDPKTEKVTLVRSRSEALDYIAGDKGKTNEAT